MNAAPGRPAPVVLVTGTGTDVGKTVVTAALTAVLCAGGLRLAVVKPVQTGLAPGEPGDLAEIVRLAGPVPTHELVRLADPLAPDAAARVAGVTLPAVREHVEAVEALATAGDFDIVLLEGAGGLLVRLDSRGGTLADLADGLQRGGVPAGFVVVVEAGLGTLNHAALTAEALQRRGLPAYGLVIGRWPERPGLVERCNLEDLPSTTGLPLLGRVPVGAGRLETADFASRAAGWLDLGALTGRPGSGTDPRHG